MKSSRGPSQRSKAGKRETSKKAAKIFVSAGSGGLAAKGGVAAGEKGIVVKGDVKGGIHVSHAAKPAPRQRRASGQGAPLRAYLTAVINDCRTLRLKSIAPGAARPEAEPLELASVYVDLNTDLRLPTKQSLAGHLKKPARNEPDAAARLAEDRETRLVPALEALASHRTIVLLGAPGAGKSTLVQHLALTLAQAGQGRRKSLGRLGEWWRFGALLPVRVTLRQFAAALPADGAPARAKDLWDFIAHELGESALGGKAGEWLQREVRSKGALFLLDGLDETKDQATRARVCEALCDFVRLAEANCRFILTSRPYAWAEMEESRRNDDCPPALQKEKAAFAALLDAMPRPYRIADLEPEQTALFVERWYRALQRSGWIASEKEALAKSTELQAAVQRDDHRPFARNPLLLTLMATLHSGNARLPDDRADLYDEVVKLMLQRWNENIGADRGLVETLAVPGLRLDHLRTVLERIAFEAHGRQTETTGVADIAEGDLLAALRSLLLNSADKAALAVEFIEQRAGLLLGQGSRGRQRQFTFPHRTFQEFLAGCHLAGRRDFEHEVVRLADENSGHWREVLKLAARRATASRGVPASDVLVCHRDVDNWPADPALTEREWRKAVVAAEQLLEIGLAEVDASPEHGVVRDRIARWLVALLDRGALPARERAAAGDLLGRLGDPRKGIVPTSVVELDQMEFCYEPPGDFWMGGEKPKRAKLDYGFWISRHPVTVAQFDLFVQAGGYADAEFWPDAIADKCWRDGKFKEWGSKEWSDRPDVTREPFALANHPVVNVSWYEARAFCAWLTAQWKDRVPPNWHFGLPAETEWEKAARGGERVLREARRVRVADGLGSIEGLPLQDNADRARAFPWLGEFDANKANSTEARIGATSAVGCFPSGASPCGAEDMAGNAWEWCRTDWEGARVLRGGAFSIGASGVRCAFRYRNYPDLRFHYFGFRVVASPFSEL